jgi:hypothetical protein
MEENRRLPVVIVGGLHSDARRETVERLLRSVLGSVALHHDLSAAADRRTVRRSVHDSTGQLDSGETELVNDCACCALREDLVPELERLAAGGLTPLAVVELWDSVEPQPMAEIIAAHGGDILDLTCVTTATSAASMLTSLMSLTMTATRRPSRLLRRWLSRVVLPEPRKPDRTVTGRRSARSVMARSAVRVQ